jgi:hypothetical protein
LLNSRSDREQETIMPLSALAHIAQYVAERDVHRLRQLADAHRGDGAPGAKRRGPPNPLAGTAQYRNFEHILIAGPTGLGKGELIKRLTAELDAPDAPDGPALMAIDCDGKLSLDMAILRQHRAASGTVIYDEIRRPGRGIGIGFPQPSTDADRQVAEAENREKTAFLKSFIGSFQGEMDLVKTVMIDEVADDLGSLVFDKNGTAGVMDLLASFQFHTAQYRALKEACWNTLTRGKWSEHESLPPIEWRAKLVPLRRRIEKILRRVQLRNRTQITVNLAAFLNDGGWFLVGAGSEGDLGREDATKLCRLILFVLIGLAWSRKLTRRVIVILDEGMGLKLIDATLARALAELRKHGIQFVLVIQDPLTLDEATRKAVMDNCRFKYIFAQSEPDAAEYFGRMLRLRKLEVETKYTTYSVRRVIDHYEDVPTRGQSVSRDAFGGKRVTETTGAHSRPVYGDVMDAQDHPYTFQELILKEAGTLMGMGVGQFMISSTSYVSNTPEHFTMVQMPWDGLFHPGPPRMPLAEYKLRKLLRVLHETNPVYQLRPVPFPTWEAAPKTNGKPKANGQTKANGKPKPNGKSRAPSPMQQHAIKRPNGSSSSSAARPRNRFAR